MDEVTFDKVLSLAEQLAPADQAALAEHLQAAQHAHDLSEWGDLIDQMAGGSADDPM